MKPGQTRPGARISRERVQGLETAQRAQEEEELRAREVQAQRQAQAAEDERVAQLLDAVSKSTQQDIADLDRAAILADNAAGPTFECPLLFIECDKVRPPPPGGPSVVAVAQARPVSPPHTPLPLSPTAHP